MKTEDDWQAIEEKYAIRRTHKNYWQYADYFNETWLNRAPLESGILILIDM